MKKEIIIGAISNALFLLIFAFLYQRVFRLWVISYKWATFLGEFWFFIFVILFFPIMFFIFGKKYLSLGAILGIGLYFMIGVALLIIMNIRC